MEFEPQLEIKQKNKRKKFFNTKIILIIFTIIMFLGISFSAIFYRDEGENYVRSGLISINFINGTENININDAVPMLDEVGIESDPYIFTVENTSKIPINVIYELEVDKEKTTIPLSAVKYAFYINGKLISTDTVSSIENNLLYMQKNVKVEESNSAKLVFWIDYYYDGQYKNFNAKIKVTGESFDIIYNMNDSLKSKIENSLCKSSVTDEDGTIYLSGTNDCVNFNYVWYSGKLWRITSINPDGTLKLVTDDSITSLNYGNAYTFDTSWVYEWLNQEFLPTLQNREQIIVPDVKWNATLLTANTKPPETTMVTSDVGLLTAYEYVQSYTNATTATTYLNNNYAWWLLTPNNATTMRAVLNTGALTAYAFGTTSIGVRPSIILKNDVQISSGNGTKEKPYRFAEDISKPEYGKTKLSERVSGEYVKFANASYRIIGLEYSGSNNVKINMADYIRDSATGAIMASKALGANITYGNGTVDNQWDHYLNNTWLTALENDYPDYRKMMVKGTYYLGVVGNTTSYKAGVCSDPTTKDNLHDCKKTTSKVEFDVGISTFGDMFALQPAKTETVNNMWLMTPFTTANARLADTVGLTSNGAVPASGSALVRPTVTLSADVVITGGEGTENDPFEIALLN